MVIHIQMCAYFEPFFQALCLRKHYIITPVKNLGILHESSTTEDLLLFHIASVYLFVSFVTLIYMHLRFLFVYLNFGIYLFIYCYRDGMLSHLALGCQPSGLEAKTPNLHSALQHLNTA